MKCILDPDDPLGTAPRIPREEPAPKRPGARVEWQLPPKYQVLRVLGTGGMGTVLLARDRNLGRLLAVKLLHTECPDFLGRLRREARLLARFEHPSIVRVHELDVHAGRNYLAMEYLSGGNLALARLAPAELVTSLRGVVDALGHAHAHGIVHRDVKPENVLLRDAPRTGGRPPRAVLSDFGLAVPALDGTGPRFHPVAGTPATMSPEQTRGEALGPPSDIFSLGVTLYRKLSGRWPFRGRTVSDVLEAILHRDPEPLQDLESSVPRRLQAVVLRALAKDPAQRFACVREFGDELERSLRAPSRFFHPGTWFGRRLSASGPDTDRIHPEDLS